MKIKSNFNCVHYFEDVAILPNVNDISDEDYNKIKDNPVFKCKLDEGLFETKYEFNLQILTQAKAIKSVNDCIDINLLNSELEKETREAVRKAILNRIKDISTPEEVK
ncbi:hypothetical protein GCL60_16525 [Silvanigrella paludirubra]|uniref:Uncharacterized protein n=1 Tax=Silvanigrella paludirubra TaxID=2499159 RepID=A0A6N6VN63_9BACT|nr:hypothetical protein [Silvanigrella paludirubra]KAB8035834.1 hypothetical protein GCL60_16525 [Silvanigrella paludirubra]